MTLTSGHKLQGCQSWDPWLVLFVRLHPTALPSTRLVESSSAAERTTLGVSVWSAASGRHDDSVCKCVSLNFLNLWAHPQHVLCV